MKTLELFKKLIDEGCSLYNVYFLVENNKKERCRFITCEEHQIILEGMRIENFDADEVIDDVGDFYLELILNREHLSNSFVSRGTKEYVYTGVVVDSKKGEIIFSWHSDITYHL